MKKMMKKATLFLLTGLIFLQVEGINLSSIKNAIPISNPIEFPEESTIAPYGLGDDDSSHDSGY